MERCWADLLNLILSKLFGKDPHELNLACRSWHSAAVGSPYHPRWPCLMYCKVTERSWKFFQYNSSFIMDADYFSETADQIRCTKYGWVLMSQDDNSVFFFDPFHNRRIKVPGSSDCSYNTMHFFHPPTSPDCFIVGATNLGYKSLVIGVLRQGEGEWVRQVFQDETDVDIRFFFGFAPWIAVQCARKEMSQRLMSLNIGNCPLGKPDSNSCSKSGEEGLFAAFVVYEEREVKVYRLLESTMTWGSKKKWGLVGDYFVSDKVLYLSHSSSFGATARVKSMGNKVYFTELCGESPMFYTLEDKRYHFLDGNYMDSDDDRGRLDFAAWIVPALNDSSISALKWMQSCNFQKN